MKREEIFIMSEKCFICDTELESGTKVIKVKSKDVAFFRLPNKSEKKRKQNFS